MTMAALRTDTHLSLIERLPEVRESNRPGGVVVVHL